MDRRAAFPALSFLARAGRRTGGPRPARAGTTVTEFAVLLPMIVLVLISVLEGGRMFTVWLSMEQAVRDSARAGAVAVGDPARQPTLAAAVHDLTVDRLTSLGLDPAGLTVTVAVGVPPTGFVDIDARYVLDVSSPLMRGMVGEGFTLRAHSAMRIE